MTWAKLDDQFYCNEKQLKMSHAAFRLYVCSLSFASQEKEPTGFLARARARGLAGMIGVGSRQINELVALSAWEEVDDGWLIHDFDQYVDRGSAERTRAWRERKRDGTATSHDSHGDVSRARAHAGGNPGPEPVPVPVRDKALPESSTTTGRFGSNEPHEDPIVVAVARVWQERVGTPSAADLAWLRRVPYECPRLTPELAVDAAQHVVGNYLARGNPPKSMKLLAGRFADTDHLLADEGVQRPRRRSANGMASAGDVLTDRAIDRIIGGAA